MTEISVFDAAFGVFGRVIDPAPFAPLLEELERLPMPPESWAWQPREDCLHSHLEFAAQGEALLGEMPYQLGWCMGGNRRADTLARHGGGTFVISRVPFSLILSSRDRSQTARVTVPEGVALELYGDTWRSAPLGEGLRILVLQPFATNTGLDLQSPADGLHARNTWITPA